jgi:hypothetical protein
MQHWHQHVFFIHKNQVIQGSNQGRNLWSHNNTRQT